MNYLNQHISYNETIYLHIVFDQYIIHLDGVISSLNKSFQHQYLFQIFSIHPQFFFIRIMV